jgi:uncharacterized protein YwqG
MVAAYKIPSLDELSRMSAAELAQSFVDGAQAKEGTGHVGRLNRLSRHQWNIRQALKARGEARRVFEQLAGHSDPAVRSSAKSLLERLDKPPQEIMSDRQRTLSAKFLWQCDHPPPSALTRDEIAALLRQRVPNAADRLVDLALPAIGLWPQRRADVPALASRFGGMPLAPPDWQWPIVQQEPLLFVGHINCAEMRGLPAAELLPTSGLVSFFADYEALVGAFPFGDHCAFYWPDVAKLVPPAVAIEPLEIFPTCAVVQRSIVDLPHPHSRVVRELGMNEQLRKAYFDVWMGVRDYGIPSDCVGHAGFSKMFGWPDLVQNDFLEFAPDRDDRLLLQVDRYCNGEEAHNWGPGGTLYYYLSASDLRAGHFERCELEGQFT